VFALAYLLGIELLPRIRVWKEAQALPPSEAFKSGIPENGKCFPDGSKMAKTHIG
jgi:hypothetical protein